MGHRTDGVNRHVGRLQQVHQVAAAQRTARVAAVGVQQHDFAALETRHAVHCDPDGIEERRHPLDLLPPDPLDQAGKIGLRVTGGADLGVEVDYRDIRRVDEQIEKLDRGGARERHVIDHAFAEVEQHPEVQRGDAGIGAGRPPEAK